MGFRAGDRVQAAPHLDRWMKGDRYGTVHSTSRRGMVVVEWDKSGETSECAPANLTAVTSPVEAEPLVRAVLRESEIRVAACKVEMLRASKAIDGLTDEEWDRVLNELLADHNKIKGMKS